MLKFIEIPRDGIEMKRVSRDGNNRKYVLDIFQSRKDLGNWTIYFGYVGYLNIDKGTEEYLLSETLGICIRWNDRGTFHSAGNFYGFIPV